MGKCKACGENIRDPWDYLPELKVQYYHWKLQMKDNPVLLNAVDVMYSDIVNTITEGALTYPRTTYIQRAFRGVTKIVCGPVAHTLSWYQ